MDSKSQKKKIKINFNEESFNSLYFPYIKSNFDYEIYWGGGGSGKSVFVAQKELIKCLTQPYYRLIYCRKTETAIRDSQYQLFKDIVNDWGLTDFFQFKEQPMDIICLINGNKMLAQGLDQIEKVKSISEPTDIWVEEATECEQRDIEQLGLRIRTKKVDKIQYILSFNPIDEQHWIKKQFFPDDYSNEQIYEYTKEFKEGDRIIKLDYLLLHSTYKDNKFLPDSYLARLHNLANTNENYHQVYKLGMWGRMQSGTEFYKCFKYKNQVSDNYIYNENLPLHITFDFNINPYVTLCIWQCEGKIARQIDEICMQPPQNRTADVCKRFISIYGDHKAGLFIYGDPAGKQEDTRSEKGHNDYNIITTQLQRYYPQLRISSTQPSISMRGNFINAIFEFNYDDIEIYYSSKCKNTIQDYLYLKQNADGTKLKEKIKDKITGVTYEKYGHCTDANDYFLCYYFADEYNNFRDGNKKLEYRYGAKVVTNSKAY